MRTSIEHFILSQLRAGGGCEMTVTADGSLTAVVTRPTAPAGAVTYYLVPLWMVNDLERQREIVPIPPPAGALLAWAAPRQIGTISILENGVRRDLPVFSSAEGIGCNP